MWGEAILKKIKQGKTYQRSEVVALLKEERPGLCDNSYVWAVGNLLRKGLLQHEGRNRYSLATGIQKRTYSPFYSQEAQDIRDAVEEKYPRIGFTVFESTLLNEFINHQIARNTIFIQTERSTGAFLFDFLRETSCEQILYRPSGKEYSRYWKPDSIIILDWTSEAPLNHAAPHDITIEKLLVDTFCDKTIQLTYSAAEYQTIVKTAYQRYFVDTVKMLRYARRRHKEEEIKTYIQ